MTAYTDYETRAIESEARDRAVQGLKDEFLAAVRKGDMDAPAIFAPMVTRRYMGMDVRVCPTVGEVLLDAIDNSDFSATSMRILRDVAYSDEPHVLASRELLDRMAAKWADNVYEGE